MNEMRTEESKIVSLNCIVFGEKWERTRYYVDINSNKPAIIFLAFAQIETVKIFIYFCVYWRKCPLDSPN